MWNCCGVKHAGTYGDRRWVALLLGVLGADRGRVVAPNLPNTGCRAIVLSGCGLNQLTGTAWWRINMGPQASGLRAESPAGSVSR